MNTRIVTDMEGFQSLQEDWERLELQDPDATYYSTFQFNYFWWKTHSKDPGKQLFIVCCLLDNRIVGIAPLMIRRDRSKLFSCSTLCFIGQGDYFTFLLERGSGSEIKILKELFGAFHAHDSLWDKFELTHLTQESQLLHYLLRHEQYNEHVQYLTSCPVIPIREHETYERLSQTKDFIKMKKTRDKLRKQVNYRFKVVTGEQNAEIYDRVARVHRLLKEYLQTEKGRSERRSLFENEYTDEFLRRLFRNNEQVVVFMLEDERGEIINYSICYLYKDVLYDWNSGYAPEYSTFHGLANVLMIETLEHLFKEKLGKRLDCGAGSYAWKFKWTSRFNVNYTFKMWNLLKARGRLYRFLSGFKTMLQTAFIMTGMFEIML